ncbi:hypothetical protein SKAU_G00028000 [Synaphobranchus kaupii]|uniref:Uncharacterized protein n=1 Tax=Synaphobranchus kaupii TaxID=118154 RepID=A0A9Q1GF07_SYNKA|nr:hypothetical protein SKAU_G00028000 [Synaphobranchus kaupii]
MPSSSSREASSSLCLPRGPRTLIDYLLELVQASMQIWLIAGAVFPPPDILSPIGESPRPGLDFLAGRLVREGADQVTRRGVLERPADLPQPGL